jgi:hypothetical protein
MHFAELARENAEASRRSPGGFLVGAMMAGAYIGIAMLLALSFAAGIAAEERPLVMGVVFGVGLILSVFAGAELFTGDVLYVGFGLARGRVNWSDVLRLLSLVWLGNWRTLSNLPESSSRAAAEQSSPEAPSCFTATSLTGLNPTFSACLPARRSAGSYGWESGRPLDWKGMPRNASYWPGFCSPLSPAASSIPSQT